MSGDDTSNTNIISQAAVGTVLINGYPIVYESIRVTISIERFPRDFDIVTSQSHLQYDPQPGDSVSIVMANNYTVNAADGSASPTPFFTGWVDSVQRRFDSHGHSVVIRGRSLCGDLADCSAELPSPHGNGIPSAYVQNVTLGQLANQLCQPYGLAVKSTSEVDQQILKQIDVNIGDTPYEIIERVARSQNMIVMDTAKGELLLCDVGAGGSCGSGFELGKNIQSITTTMDNAQRYSIYNVFTQAVLSQNSAVMTFPFGTAIDLGIARHRRLMGFSEAPYVNIQNWETQRAVWERNRRYGRSQAVQIVTDQWFDVAGFLLEPNQYVSVKAPRLDFDTTTSQDKWLIAEATFSKNNQSGTTATLTIMPESAFAIEPVSLTRLDPAWTNPIPPAGQSPGQ